MRTDGEGLRVGVRSGAYRRWSRALVAATVIGSALATAPVSQARATLAPTTAITSWTSGQNWSGYSRTDAHFTAVHGALVVPTVSTTCGARSATAVYVGLGGLVPGSHRFVQAGFTVTPTINGIHGAWYELFSETATPDPVNVPFAARPGDHVAVLMRYRPTTNTLRVTWSNRTRGTSVSRTVGHASTWVPTGRYAVADWITERPNYPDVGSPMASAAPVRWSRLWAERSGRHYGLGAHLTRHTAVGIGGRVVEKASARPDLHAFVTRWRHCD